MEAFEAPPKSEDLARWLREERAGLELTEDEALALAELHAEHLWRDEHCVKAVVTYSKEATNGIRDMAEVIASEAVDKLVEKGKVIDRPAHRLMATKKFVTWWMVPSPIWGGGAVGGDGDGAVARPLAPALSRRPEPVLAAVEPEVRVSKACLEDMRLQGASRPEQLVMISVSTQVAQKVGPVEYAGAVYGGSVSAAAIIKRMNKSSKGARTLDDLLREAMITGEISEVGRHIRKASTRFMEDRDDRLVVDAGGNLSQLWSRAQELKREDGEPRLCIKYMQLYIDEHGCKGFPTINDWALIYDAEHFDYAREHLKETSRGSRLPVQQPAKREQDSLNEKFDSLIDVVKDVAKKQQALTDTVDEIRSKHDRTIKDLGDLKSRVGRDFNRDDRDDRDRRGDRDKGKGDKKCKWCKSPDHFVSECPEMLKRMKEDRADGSKD